MLADELLRSLTERGEDALRPVFLLLGEESHFAEEVVKRLTRVCQRGGIAGFNEERFVAGECAVDEALAAARSMPMMAKRRFVLVRSVERWEAKSDEDRAPSKKKSESALDRLASYAADPSPSTVLVLVAPKLHASRRIVTLAKKEGFLVQCDPLKRQAIPGYVTATARAKGHPIAPSVASHVADLIGTDVGAIVDAIERLSLYAGAGAPITEEAVVALVAPIRSAMMWDLTDAICARDTRKALVTLSELDMARGAELPVLGAIAGSVRKLTKFQAAIEAGQSAGEAAEKAGLPPFKASSMAQLVKRLPRGTTARWLRTLAEADLALKGQARRGGRAVLEGTILAMCRG
jgi:DNA polymerase-3 subunit delta